MTGDLKPAEEGRRGPVSFSFSGASEALGPEVIGASLALLGEYLDSVLNSEDAREEAARTFVDELLKRYSAEDGVDGP